MNNSSPGTSPRQRGTARQFSIETLLLAITFVAVSLGVLRLSLGLGILMLVFAVPAFLRTCYFGASELRMGYRFTFGDKLSEFFFSLLILVLATGFALLGALIGGIVAGIALLLLGCQPDNAGFGSLIAACGTGLGAAAYLIYVTRSRRG